jgi:hypothetical protein
MPLTESSLAAADSGDEQETGIQVDLDSDDPSKAVQRQKPARAVGPKPKNWHEDRAETSKAVKKRLDRMARSYDQRFAEQQAEFQRQLAERDKRIDAFSRGGEATSDVDKAHELAMEKFQADLEDAQERGDSKAVSKITAEMARAEGRYWAQKAAKQGVDDKPNERAAPAQTAAQTPRPTKAGVAWAKANADWWNDTVDEIATDARAFANSMHARKQREGDDPEDPAYFEEIGAAVRRRFPELDVKTVSGKRGQIDEGEDEGLHRNPRREAPPIIQDRGAAPKGRGLRSVTHADISGMRAVGLDPNNNKHVMQWLQSGQEVEMQE